MLRQGPIPRLALLQRVVVLELPFDRQVPDRVPPRWRVCHRARGARQGLVLPGRRGHDVRVREGQGLVDERAELRPAVFSGEELGRDKARAEFEFGADGLSAAG